MKAPHLAGCPEYLELSRRQFLGVTGGLTALATAAPAWLPRVAFARHDCTGRDTIVSIFLRGASDGLTVCVPHAEDAYYTARPTLAIPRPDSGDPDQAIDLDGFFGLPPAMAPLVEAYDAGHLAIVHACGSHHPTRSHFDAQRFMEVGIPGELSTASGWLGRHLLTSAPTDPEALVRAIGIGYALARTLAGGPATLPVPDPTDFGLTGPAGTEADRLQALADLYAQAQEPLKSAAGNTMSTIALLEAIDFAGYQPAGGAVYPQSDLGRALRSTAALIKAEVGVEAVAIDVGGWDTHDQQGPIDGTLAGLMADLAAGLSAFHADVFADTTNLTLVAMSEFGRRLGENGSLGTDHGHGNAMLVMGDSIQGGQVLADWPGLQAEELFEERDLAVTIDYRDVLAEIVELRLMNPDLAGVFPGHTPIFHGITRPCPS